MNFSECLEFAKKAGGCTIATIDGDQPRVRAMVPLWLKEDGIYFTTAASKDLFSQISANPKVEVCFFTLDPLKHLRLTGVAEIVNDLTIKAKAL
ncbi:MAG: pyridoxamine 5'-phosphate oxidase family protein, partial [Eubacteriales bacterium]